VLQVLERVRHLIHSCGVAPSSILVLAPSSSHAQKLALRAEESFLAVNEDTPVFLSAHAWAREAAAMMAGHGYAPSGAADAGELPVGAAAPPPTPSDPDVSSMEALPGGIGVQLLHWVSDFLSGWGAPRHGESGVEVESQTSHHLSNTAPHSVAVQETGNQKEGLQDNDGSMAALQPPIRMVGWQEARALLVDVLPCLPLADYGNPMSRAAFVEGLLASFHDLQVRQRCCCWIERVHARAIAHAACCV